MRAAARDQEADEEGAALLVSGTQLACPMTNAEVLHSPDADEWHKACDEELASLTQHQVSEMEIPSPGKRVVRSKWVFKQKLNGLVVTLAGLTRPDPSQKASPSLRA
jgi:hypothetical protein